MGSRTKVSALVSVALAGAFLCVQTGTAQAAPSVKSAYSGVGYIFVCHGQELAAVSGSWSSVYNANQVGNTLKESTNVSTAPSLILRGEDGLSYSIQGRSNAVVDTTDYGTYSVASGKYSYDFTIYRANGSTYGTLKGKSAVLPNQDVEPLSGTCAD